MGTLKITDANKKRLSEEGKQRLLDDLARHKKYSGPAFAATVKICGQLFGEPGGLESQFYNLFSF